MAIQASDKLDVAACTAIPLADLKSRLNSFLIILLRIGLALGTAMAVAVVLLAHQRGSLPVVLQALLKRKEFVLHCQPIMELASGRMIGVEALLRWLANKQIGMHPALFIQVAEKCGPIQRFIEYVLVHVASDAQRFLARHPDC